MATKQRLVRLSFFSKRKPNLTEDEFQTYWTKEHGPLALEWLARHGIIKYTQYHTPPSLQASAITGFPALKHLPAFSFDGSADFLMPDISCFQKAREDPYYASHIAPDEDKLFDWESARWTVGWEEVYVKDGKVVDLPFGDSDFPVTAGTQKAGEELK